MDVVGIVVVVVVECLFFARPSDFLFSLFKVRIVKGAFNHDIVVVVDDVMLAIL